MTNRMPRGRAPTVDDAEIIKVAKSVDDPVFTVKEVAEGIDLTHQMIRNRLSDLIDQGVLTKKKVSSGHVYWFCRD